MRRSQSPNPASRGEAMSPEDLQDTLIKQVREVRSEHPDLMLEKGEGGRFAVVGRLGFCVSRDGKDVEDAYEVEIVIPRDYPLSPPSAKEIGGRIPKSFHRLSDDGTLCLGAPLAVRMVFAGQPNLLSYIQNQVIPLLFSHSYKELYGEMPYGELPHGGEGILEYYREIFAVDEVRGVLGLLQILADDSYRGHYPCPCNSGRNLRKCHGPTLLAIKEYQGQDEFLVDFLIILQHVKGDGDIREFCSVVPRRIVERSRCDRKPKR